MPQPVNTQQSTAEPMGLFNIGKSRPTVHPIWVDVQINENRYGYKLILDQRIDYSTRCFS